MNTTSARVAAGLGTIARVVASGETIYRGKLTFAEAERRMREFWQPFHETLGALIDGTRAVFGACLLIDCHSMPSHVRSGGRGGKLADFVLGDAHGTACDPTSPISSSGRWRIWATGCAATIPTPAASSPATTAGRARMCTPCRLEIARDLYMDEARFERSAAVRRGPAAI